MKFVVKTRPVGTDLFPYNKFLKQQDYNIVDIVRDSRTGDFIVTLDLSKSKFFKWSSQCIKDRSVKKEKEKEKEKEEEKEEKKDKKDEEPLPEFVQLEPGCLVWRSGEYTVKLFWCKKDRDEQVEGMAKLKEMGKKIYDTFDNPDDNEYGFLAEYVPGTTLETMNMGPELEAQWDTLISTMKKLDISHTDDFYDENFVLTPSGIIKCIHISMYHEM